MRTLENVWSLTIVSRNDGSIKLIPCNMPMELFLRIQAVVRETNDAVLRTG